MIRFLFLILLACSVSFGATHRASTSKLYRTKSRTSRSAAKKYKPAKHKMQKGSSPSKRVRTASRRAVRKRSRTRG